MRGGWMRWTNFTISNGVYIYIYKLYQLLYVAIIYTNASIALEIIGPPKNRDLPWSL